MDDLPEFKELLNSIQKFSEDLVADDETLKSFNGVFAEILNSVKVKKRSFKSVDEHKSSIKTMSLSYDDLLNYAASSDSSCEVLEHANETLKRLLDARDSLLTNMESWSDIQKNCIKHLVSLHDMSKANIATMNYLKGQVVGSDARKKIMAKNGALAKIKIDPRQDEKILVRNCWIDWQKKPDNYKSKAAFSRDMLEKCEHLKSQKKIEDWCREWEKTPPSQHNEHLAGTVLTMLE